MLWRVFLKIFKALLQWLEPAGVDTTLVSISFLSFLYTTCGADQLSGAMALVLGLMANRKVICEQGSSIGQHSVCFKGLHGLGALEWW